MKNPCFSLFHRLAVRLTRSVKTQEKERQKKLDRRLIQTASHYPSTLKDIKRLEKSINKGANANAHQGAALAIAAQKGNFPVVAFLLNKKALVALLPPSVWTDIRRKGFEAIVVALESARKKQEAGSKAKILPFRPYQSPANPALFPVSRAVRR